MGEDVSLLRRWRVVLRPGPEPGSAWVEIPEEVLDFLAWPEDQEVEITVVGGVVWVKRRE